MKPFLIILLLLFLLSFIYLAILPIPFLDLVLLGLLFGLILALLSLVNKSLPKGRKWENLPVLVRSLVSNSFFVLIIWGMIVYLPIPIPSLRDLENYFIDFMMDSGKGAVSPLPDGSPGFVVFDIDQETYENWGKPERVPPDKLQDLIDVAVSAKARLVVVDIQLDVTPHEIQKQIDFKPRQDLKGYLTRYVENCKELSPGSCTPIVFFQTHEDKPKISTSTMKTSPGFLDDLINSSSPYLQWGTAYFYSFNLGFDSVENSPSKRWWSLWEFSCDEISSALSVVPSIALLILGEAQKNETCMGEIQQELQKLQQLQPKNCDEKIPDLSEMQLNFCGLTVEANNDPFRGYRLQQQTRAIYHIPYDYGNKLPYLVIDNERKQPFILKVLRAADVNVNCVKSKDLTDNIVIIGTSFKRERGTEISSDIYHTPIGQMPGYLTIVNLAYSLLQGHVIKPIPMEHWGVFVCVILITLLLTWFNHRVLENKKSQENEKCRVRFFSFEKETSILAGLIFLVLGITSTSWYLLIEQQIWLNIAIPFLVIYIFIKVVIPFVEWMKTKLTEGGKN